LGRGKKKKERTRKKKTGGKEERRAILGGETKKKQVGWRVCLSQSKIPRERKGMGRTWPLDRN